MMLIAIGVLYAAPAASRVPLASSDRAHPIAPEVTLAGGNPGGGDPARTATIDE
jgi:hypothetical protein